MIAIDLSSSSFDRFPIFAHIGVPEVWRYDGTRSTIFTLRAGTYQEVAASAVFPGVTSQIISQFMAEGATMPCAAWLRRVRVWARRQRRGGRCLFSPYRGEEKEGRSLKRVKRKACDDHIDDRVVP